ncbi:hypothetical protein [Actinokineospora globicatena]|uniref:Tetratricopeptide repeat-containing protein n=1 Tax=Actinokineospora globicatena TaxID=103729 RepID=A0A9W6VBR3_9PSEU|nr:hypothetical protein [Actinokineospora globicatena]GLW93213.1 hypothetical protein Aglo03_40290 [Actinokineospora globicatena]
MVTHLAALRAAAAAIEAALNQRGQADLLPTTFRLAGSLAAAGAHQEAERLLSAARQSYGGVVPAGVRLGLVGGVLAAGHGDRHRARQLFEDAQIDAGRGAPELLSTTMVNLAALATQHGDFDTARRKLPNTTADSPVAEQAMTGVVRAAIDRHTADAESFREATSAQWESAQRYLAEAGAANTHALSAGIAAAAAQVDAALSAGDVTVAENAADVLDLLVQRMSAAIGADHPHALVARSARASADFQLAREADDQTGMQYALDVLHHLVSRFTDVLGEDHLHTIATRANLACTRYELARRTRSLPYASEALTALRAAVVSATAALGERHPISLGALANLATAEFELATSEGTEVDLAQAAATLDRAQQATTAVFGPQHATTRLLRHELDLCHPSSDGPSSGNHEGTVLTHTTRTTSTPFGDDYVHPDHAAQAIRGHILRFTRHDAEDPAESVLRIRFHAHDRNLLATVRRGLNGLDVEQSTIEATIEALDNLWSMARRSSEIGRTAIAQLTVNPAVVRVAISYLSNSRLAALESFAHLADKVQVDRGGGYRTVTITTVITRLGH